MESAAPTFEHLARLTERIAEAAARVGRPPGSVKLIAATKTAPPERLRALWGAGCRAFGENRVQEATLKIAALSDLAAEWHFIGHLQRNKAKSIPGRFTWIHSLDTLALAQTLERVCAAQGATLSCLVEVNMSGDPAKHGLAPEELPPLLEGAAALPHLCLEGLMTMASAGADEAALRRIFAGLRELARRHNLAELSMGMSDDFEIAIEEGATLVRIGRALLGDRP